MNPKTKKQLLIWTAASLTLGLAPFFPEPHIVGKLTWIFGGAQGMKPMDWFDFVMHGFPWMGLGYWVVQAFFKKV